MTDVVTGGWYAVSVRWKGGGRIHGCGKGESMKRITLIISLTLLFISLMSLNRAETGLSGGLRRRSGTGKSE